MNGINGRADKPRGLQGGVASAAAVIPLSE
jgi:hypothetical protein